MKRQKTKSSLSRRKLLAGVGAAAITAGVVGAWPRDWGTVVAGDRTAKSEYDFFDRGLVPVTKSGWTMPEGVQSDFPSLFSDITADIAIIGAGLAGSSLALHLAEAGISVAVLEARTPGWGASGRNAGHVLPILKDLSVFESFPDKGKRFLAAFRDHHTIPFDLSEKYGIEADAIQSGYLNVMVSEKAQAAFIDNGHAFDAIGLPRPLTVGGSELKQMTGTDYWSHGVLYPNGGRINPYLLSNGLAKAAISQGGKVFANSSATRLDPSGKRWKVSTENGSVTADRVVFCTNAYPADIVPSFANSFYPLTAYALTTLPLEDGATSLILPGGQTLAQAPVDLNPLVKDRHNRLILSSIPRTGSPEDAAWHFKNQLQWIHKVWPESRAMQIELETYWTGRVAMRGKEFPGVYEAQPGVFGLMHFNAWGNVMAPLMGKLFAEGLASGDLTKLPFPIETAQAVKNPGKQDRNIRQWMIPAARQAQRWGILK